MTGDPYQVLGVSHDADAEQIKQAYRQLAKKYHPDLHPGDAEAARRMNEINEAYDLIKNPDAYRQQQRQQAYQQQTYRQQTYQTYQNTQSGDPFDSFFRDAGGRQYWVHFGGYQNPNSQQSQQNGQRDPYGQNPYQWTYHTTRRPRSLLWRLFTVWLAIQLFLSLFGGCAYRLGTDHDENAYSIPPSSSYSEPYGGSSTTQPRRNPSGFGSIWN